MTAANQLTSLVPSLCASVDDSHSPQNLGYEPSNEVTRPCDVFPDSAATAPKFSSNAEAASFWNRYGLSVMPIVPANKCPAFKFKLWLKDLTPAKIAQAYAKNKFLEVGFVVGDGLIVLDADSPESEKALIAIELEHGVSPKLVVKTKKGCHHYFQLAPSAFAKSDAHSSALFPAISMSRLAMASLFSPQARTRKSSSSRRKAQKSCRSSAKTSLMLLPNTTAGKLQGRRSRARLYRPKRLRMAAV